MPILKPEHIIKLIFDDFCVTESEIDLCDDIYFSSIVLGGDYKVCITFEPKSITFHVFKYNDDPSVTITLDAIFQITECQNKEYSEDIAVLYSAGDFIDTYWEDLCAACKELSLETQVLSGSLFDKYVKQKG